MKKLLLMLLALACLGAVGARPTNVLLLKFADYPDDEPCTVEHAGDVVFGQYAPWIFAESRGIEWLAGDTQNNVYGWLTLPHPLAHYNCQFGPDGYPGLNSCSATLLDDAAALAYNQFGINPYIDNRLTVFVYNAGMRGGAGGFQTIQTGCNFVCNPTCGAALTLRGTMIHEGFHAEPERIFHSGSWLCSTTDSGPDYTLPTAGGCTVSGDQWEPGEINSHFSMWMRSRLHWTQPSNTQMIERSQVVQITDAAVQTDAVQEVRVQVSQDWAYFYTIEYRAADAGVLVRLRIPQPYFLTYETLLVNSNNHFVNGNFAVTATNPFVDAYRGISVELLASDSMQATLAITTQTGIGGPHPPGKGRKKNDR